MLNVGYSDGAPEGSLDMEGVPEGTSDNDGLPVGASVGVPEGTRLVDGARLIVGELVNRALR